MNLVVVVAVNFAFNAFGFTLNGDSSNVKGWKSKEVEFRLNPENCPDSVDQYLSDAMDAWNHVPTANIQLRRGSDIDVNLAELSDFSRPEVPAIVCSTNIQGEIQQDPNSIPGVAVGFRAGADQHINYGVIVLNVQENALANISTMDSNLVKVVLAHEMGHVLGLGHSDTKDALMYYDGTPKKHLSLAQDDVDGISYLYPRDELQGDPLMGCGTIRGATPLQMTLILGIPLLMLFFRRRQSLA